MGKINLLQYTTGTASALDKRFVLDGVTTFFEDNASDIEFIKDKYCMLGSMDMSGLGDYSRTNGFPKGSLSETTNIYQLPMDRGRSFQLDAMDAVESVVKKNTEWMSEFQRTKVAPEVDAFNFSTLAYWAEQAGHMTSSTHSSSTIIAALSAAIGAVEDIVGETEPLVIFASRFLRGLIDAGAATNATINFGDFKKGAFNTKVKTFNDIPLLKAPTAVFKDKFTFLNGQDDSQYQGGFIPTSGAKELEFIVMPKKAAKLITKTKKIRIFTPDNNPTADGWQFDYRRYYGLVASVEWQKTIVACKKA